MKKIIYLLISALLVCSATAVAAPSVNGPTGVINTPAADTLRPGQFSIGYYHLGSNSEIANFNMNLAKNWEIGITGDFGNGKGTNIALNTKFSIALETVATPGIAIGVDGIASNRSAPAYAVASKSLPLGFRVSAGVGGGRYNDLFASIEKSLNPISLVGNNNFFPVTSLICEYDGSNMNYGARMAIVPDLKADLGLRGNGHQAYFGLTYTH